jgi:quercetin dioxygenase-like cupin family protein
MARRPTSLQIIRYTTGDIRLLVSSDETSGAMSMIETVNAPGTGPPWHCHSREDEVFYVNFGVAEVQVGEEVYRLETGDRVIGRRNATLVMLVASTAHVMPVADMARRITR